MTRWADIVPGLTGRLAAAGLDLSSWTPVGRYNEAVAAAYRLPDLGDPATPCLVFGNSRAFWPIFLAARRRDQLLRAHPHPVDEYTARVCRAEAAALGVAYELRLASELPPRRVAMQRLAHLAGLAHLGPAHLTVHPEVGPWHGLRAALVLDVSPPAPPPPAPDLCGPCPKPCLEAMDAALATSGPGPTWPRWLAVRDVCPVGLQARYGDDQVRYHYSHDPAALEGQP